MRIIIAAIGILLALAPAQAAAQQWYRIGGNEKQMSYVDLASLRPIGGKIVAVTESIYASALEGEIFATAIRSEYDCAGGYFRTLEYSYYNFGGKLLSSEASQSINEHKVPQAGSINEGMLEFICYRKGGVAVTGDIFSDARAQLAAM